MGLCKNVDEKMVKFLYANCYTYNEISERMGVSVKKISKILKPITEHKYIIKNGEFIEAK